MASGDAGDDLTTGRLRMLQGSTAVVHADWARGAVHVREALVHLGDRWRDDPVGRFAWNLLARDIDRFAGLATVQVNGRSLPSKASV